MKNSLNDVIYEDSHKALNWEMQIKVDAFDMLTVTVIVGIIFIL